MSLDTARSITDFSGLAELKTQARTDQGEAVDEVAQRFESLFIQMALKRMREASFGGGLLDSKQSLFYRDLYDKQLASDLSSMGGIGLASRIKEQLNPGAARQENQADAGLSRLQHPIPRTVRLAPNSETSLQKGAVGASNVGSGPIRNPVQFVRELRPAAVSAAAELGVQTEALLAQAALETGWGKHVMGNGEGGSSHNLFGIKADARWQGERVTKTTLEYKDGVAVQTRADFRAYGSYEEAFSDYANFLKTNPRYRQALDAVSDPSLYFQELQKAGYATDPAYADKIGRILGGANMQQALREANTEPAATGGADEA